MSDHLFVYGTLRAGSSHPMAHRLRVGAKHLGRGSAPGLLYDFGDHPGAMFDPNARYRVIGDGFVIELGSVDPAAQHLLPLYHDLGNTLGRTG